MVSLDRGLNFNPIQLAPAFDCPEEGYVGTYMFSGRYLLGCDKLVCFLPTVNEVSRVRLI